MMELSSCMKCLKYTFFVFNLLFSIFGAAAVALGLWAAIDPNFEQNFHERVDEAFKDEGIPELNTRMILAAAILIIIAGAIVMFIGCFGCLGAWRESQCLLATFFAILLLITLLLLTATTLAFAFPRGISIVVKPGLKEWMHSTNYTDLSDERKEHINVVQRALKCCGAGGPESYGTQKLPPSCTQDDGRVKRGCADAFREEFFRNKTYALVLGGIGALLIVLLLLGLILSILLCCAIREKSKGGAWSAVQSNDQEEGDKD